MTIGDCFSRRTAAAAGSVMLMLAVAGIAAAVGEEPAAETDEAAPAGSAFSGSLSFDANTNFMSYGFDVWNTGTFNDLVFNPSLNLNWELPAGFTINIGTWWDVNDNAVSSIGGRAIQEVDVWGGISYAYEGFSVSATYQEWMYAGDSERIFDLGLGYDTLLSPSLMIHSRIDGNGAQEKGVVFVPSLSHTFDLGPVDLTLPVAAGFVTDGYYVPNESGFAYFSAGAQLGVPLTFIPAAYGDWAFNIGGTYYYTDPGTVANGNDNIFTGNFGIGVGF